MKMGLVARLGPHNNLNLLIVVALCLEPQTLASRPLVLGGQLVVQQQPFEEQGAFQSYNLQLLFFSIVSLATLTAFGAVCATGDSMRRNQSLTPSILGPMDGKVPPTYTNGSKAAWGESQTDSPAVSRHESTYASHSVTSSGYIAREAVVLPPPGSSSSALRSSHSSSPHRTQSRAFKDAVFVPPPGPPLASKPQSDSSTREMQHSASRLRDSIFLPTSLQPAASPASTSSSVPGLTPVVPTNLLLSEVPLLPDHPPDQATNSADVARSDTFGRDSTGSNWSEFAMGTARRSYDSSVTVDSNHVGQQAGSAAGSLAAKGKLSHVQFKGARNRGQQVDQGPSESSRSHSAPRPPSSRVTFSDAITSEENLSPAVWAKPVQGESPFGRITSALRNSFKRTSADGAMKAQAAGFVTAFVAKLVRIRSAGSASSYPATQASSGPESTSSSVHTSQWATSQPDSVASTSSQVPQGSAQAAYAHHVANLPHTPRQRRQSHLITAMPNSLFEMVDNRPAEQHDSPDLSPASRSTSLGDGGDSASHGHMPVGKLPSLAVAQSAEESTSTVLSPRQVHARMDEGHVDLLSFTSASSWQPRPGSSGSSRGRWPGWQPYDVNELYVATNGFAECNQLRGYGGLHLYLGCLFSGKHVVIKTLPNTGSDIINMACRASALLSMDPGVLPFLGVCHSPAMLVYEQPEGGTQLAELLSEHSELQLSWQARVYIAYEVAAALTALHTGPTPVLHRSLRPSVVFLTPEYHAMLTDVSLNLLTVESEEIEQDSPDRPYVDPAFLATGYFTAASDVYSLGVLILQLLTGVPASRVLEAVRSQLQQTSPDLRLVASESALLDMPQAVGLQLAQLALSCASADPAQRPELHMLLPRLQVLQQAAAATADPGAPLATPRNFTTALGDL